MQPTEINTSIHNYRANRDSPHWLQYIYTNQGELTDYQNDLSDWQCQYKPSKYTTQQKFGFKFGIYKKMGIYEKQLLFPTQKSRNKKHLLAVLNTISRKIPVHSEQTNKTHTNEQTARIQRNWCL